MAAVQTTEGRRREDDVKWFDFEPGDYRPVYNDDGGIRLLLFREPGSTHEFGRLPSELEPGEGPRWTISEDDEGRVSVSPSIRREAIPSMDSPEWHGFLEAGVWREV